MTIDQFIGSAKVAALQEVDKACHLAYFYVRTANLEQFTATDCANWLATAGFARPNVSRLEGRLKDSPNTIRGTTAWSFRLQHLYVKKLDALYPQLSEKSQEVIDDGTILPPALYQNTRGYLESLAKQINASYEHNVFDGCAVLMRRLEEVLLILSYEKLGIQAAIKDGNGNYLLLEGIVRDAVSNSTLNLSRNSKTAVEEIRKLGNYSAHKITYTCKREYIREKIAEFRAMIDELLHKSGLLI
ncbi:MAG: hypothetical protein WB622_11790 [Acidobacteriaceae bacterium]